MENNKKGGHEWFIEFQGNPGKANDLAKTIDEELKKEKEKSE